MIFKNLNKKTKKNLKYVTKFVLAFVNSYIQQATNCCTYTTFHKEFDRVNQFATNAQKQNFPFTDVKKIG